MGNEESIFATTKGDNNGWLEVVDQAEWMTGSLHVNKQVSMRPNWNIKRNEWAHKYLDLMVGCG